MFLRVLAAIAVLFLASCGSGRVSAPIVSPYRMEIQQGNFLTQEMVSQLKLGMSKDQVRFVLGTPLITDSFHADRWDYVFRRQRSGSKELEHQKLAVFFADGKLVRTEGDLTPEASADPAGIKAPEAKPVVAPVAKPEAPKQAAPAAAPEPQRAPPVAASAAKPAAASGTQADTPQEKKSWWERLKDKVK
jgi:outer membrane protein assembly factor BamE